MSNIEKIDKVEAEQMVLDYLRMMKEFREKNGRPPEFVYSCREDFLLQHGKFYEPTSWTEPFRAPKCCYANSMLLAVQRPQLKYVEGVALTEFGFPTGHGWVTDGKLAFDSTWKPEGLAYFGVEFHPRRAFEAQWDGDGSIFDDCQRGWPIFKQPWTGERTDWKRLSWAEVVERAEEEIGEKLG
jgi:hypothetical protein